MNAQLLEIRGAAATWRATDAPILVGKDILELLSSSMYVDPMAVYREYVQNAADAFDSVGSPPDRRRITIAIDRATRTVRVRDAGPGIPAADFLSRMTALGASAKRGTAARGFRGVGRLAGLAYCQELIFRTRSGDDDVISELRWDGRAMKALMRANEAATDLTRLVQRIVSVRSERAPDESASFFEVELKGIVRHRNDRLLSAPDVAEYLGQVAPVPFAPDFSHAREIEAALAPHVSMGHLLIDVVGVDNPVYRPHREFMQVRESAQDQLRELQTFTIPNLDGDTGAVGWLVHHGYLGAIPPSVGVGGLRLRVGNMQIGDDDLLQDLFAEPRFNAWCIGEVHVIDRRILPNGRRDQFEQSSHYDNLLNHLSPIARGIVKQCRESSLRRRLLREFMQAREAATEAAQAIACGRVSTRQRKTMVALISKSLASMRKVAVSHHLPESERRKLAKPLSATEREISRLLQIGASEQDPLAQYSPKVRHAYERVLSLIHECATTRSAANALADKILARLATPE